MKSAQEGEIAPPRGGSDLLVRTASAAVLAPIALGAVYIGGSVFVALVAFVCVIMLFEWLRMIEPHEFSMTFYMLAVAAALAMFFTGAGWPSVGLVIAIVAAIAAGWIGYTQRRHPLWSAFGAVYLIVPCMALVWLRLDVEAGRAFTFMLFLVVWSADSGAYAAGRTVGGPKFNPVLSPAKTWAGIFGGIIAGGLAGAGASWFIFGEGDPLTYLMIGGSLGLASVLGDITESAFKRHFGVKDSGALIPGHGGVLDRLDGMLFATSAMTAVLLVYMMAGGA